MFILDRYIAKKLLSVFCFIIVTSVIVIMLIDFFEQNDNYLHHQLRPGIIFSYYMALAPFLVNFLMPTAIFVTAVLVTAQLAKHSEVIAILSNGVTLPRLMVPFLFTAGIIGAMSFLLDGWVMAKANRHRLAFDAKYLGRSHTRDMKNIHLRVSEDQYMYLHHYDLQHHRGETFTLERIVNEQVVEKLTAPTLCWHPSLQQWEAKDWQRRTFAGLEETVETGDKLPLKLNVTPQELTPAHALRDTLTTPQLYRHIATLQRKGSDVTHLFQIEQYVRFMAPFSALILMFVGLIFAYRKRRGGMGSRIASSFVLSFIYIAFFMFTKGNAEAASTHPLFTVWLPNLIASAVGLGLYAFAEK